MNIKQLNESLQKLLNENIDINIDNKEIKEILALYSPEELRDKVWAEVQNEVNTGVEDSNIKEDSIEITFNTWDEEGNNVYLPLLIDIKDNRYIFDNKEFITLDGVIGEFVSRMDDACKVYIQK